MLTRRFVLSGLIAAPIVIKSSALMALRGVPLVLKTAKFPWEGYSKYLNGDKECGVWITDKVEAIADELMLSQGYAPTKYTSMRRTILDFARYCSSMEDTKSEMLRAIQFEIKNPNRDYGVWVYDERRKEEITRQVWQEEADRQRRVAAYEEMQGNVPIYRGDLGPEARSALEHIEKGASLRRHNWN